MSRLVSNQLKNNILSLVRELGTYQMSMRGTSLSTHNKGDCSPVTEVDLYCHQKIKSLLDSETPHICLLSEESSEHINFKLTDTPMFWCIDPLDGTRDYLSSSDHFAINIALFCKGKVEWGLIHHPTSQESLIADRHERRVYFVDAQNQIQNVSLPLTCKHVRTIVTSARVPMDGRKKTQVKQLAPHLHENPQILPISSSYKFFVLLKGDAQAYVRKAPCMNWDIAPGVLAAELAGMRIINLHSGLDFEWPENSLSLMPPFAMITQPG